MTKQCLGVLTNPQDQHVDTTVKKGERVALLIIAKQVKLIKINCQQCEP